MKLLELSVTNYIQAVRTEGMALNVLRDVIWTELYSLEKEVEYTDAMEKVFKMQE